MFEFEQGEYVVHCQNVKRGPENRRGNAPRDIAGGKFRSAASVIGDGRDPQCTDEDLGDHPAETEKGELIE